MARRMAGARPLCPRPGAARLALALLALLATLLAPARAESSRDAVASWGLANGGGLEEGGGVLAGRDGCAIYDQNSDGVPYANLTRARAIPWDTPEGRQALLSLQATCPQLYSDNGGKDGEYCCSVAQIGTLKTKLQLLHSIVVGCPACDHNFQQLWCDMTCGPHQASYVNVTKLTGDEGNLVDELDFFVAPEFGSALFDSCAEVKVSSMNVRAMDTLCMSDHCTGWHMMLRMQGQKFPGINPIAMHFPLNDTHDEAPEDYEPLNATLAKCWESPLACSCGDCPAGPSCQKPEPPPPPPPKGCTALGLPPNSDVSCLDVTLAGLYAGLLISALLWLLLWRSEPGAKGGEARDAEAAAADEGLGSPEGAKATDPLLGGKASPVGVRARATMHHSLKGFLYEERRPIVLPATERFLQGKFRSQGEWVATHPWATLGLCALFAAACCLGLLRFEVTTNPLKLWVPAGSDTAAEKEHFDKSFGKFYRVQQIILTKEDPAAPVATRQSIEMMFDIHRVIEGIEVRTDGDTREPQRLEDLCFKPFGPSGNCATQTVLQYWQMDRDTFEHKASPQPDDDPSWMEFCFQHWITEQSCFSDFKAPMDPKLVFGGFPGDQGTVNYTTQARSLIAEYLLNNDEASKEAAMAFETELVVRLKGEIAQIAQRGGFRLSFMTEVSVEQELDRESNADAPTVALSFLAMFVYMTFILGGARSYMPQTVCLQTRILLGFAGVFLVVLSVLCAAGLLSAFGVKSTLIIMEVIPFLALAIGVDNMCILAHTLGHQDAGLTTAQRVGRALSQAGPSITLAASAEVLAFLAGLLTGMPACKTFALFAATAVAIDYLFQVTAFVALLALDEARMQHGRLDCLPCMKDPRRLGAAGEEGGSLLPARGAAGRQPEGWMDRQMARLGKALQGKGAQCAVVLAFSGLFLGSLALISQLEMGLEQTIALPRDSYLQDYFQDLESQLRVGPPVYFVLKDMSLDPSSPDVNKTCSTAGCLPNSMLNQVESAARLAATSHVATGAASWIDDFMAWQDPSLNMCCRMHPENETFCAGGGEDCETCFDGNSRDPLFHLHGRPTVPQVIKTLPWFMQAVPGQDCAKAGAGAYNAEIMRSADDATGYAGVEQGEVAVARFRAYHTPLVKQGDYIECLRQAKKLVSQIRDSLGLDVYAYSIFYVFFEQYLEMARYCAETFALAGLGIMLVCYAFLGSLWASALTIFVVALVVTNMMGAMALTGVQLNAVSLTNLAMAVGISLEFCVHIVRAFSIADGSKQRRAAQALKHMGTPVFNGIAMTKLIGVAVLGFSRTAIFQVYYFRMYLSLVLVATAHAFVLLPVLLMLLGPPRLPYATPLAYGDDELDSLNGGEGAGD